MKQILINFCIAFTIITLFGIGFNGYFHEWPEFMTNVWGSIIGIALVGIIIYSRFIKKR